MIPPVLFSSLTSVFAAAVPVETKSTTSAVSVCAADISRMDDPSSDGWDSEALTKVVLDRLKTLTTHAVLDKETAATILAPQFQCGDLRPAQLPDVWREGPFTVRRGKAASGARLMSPDKFVAAWLAAAPAHAVPDSVHTKCKVLTIARSEAGLTTTVRVEREGTSAKGLVCQTMLWRCEWVAAGKDQQPGDWRLAGLTVEQFEEASRTGGTLFSEQSERIAGSSPVWHSQLAPGQPDWLRHMDTGVTIQQFGHHGIALADVDGDGLEDLYVCQPAGLPNRLFLHQPDGSVREAAADAGVDWLEPTAAAVFADLDNDGDADLILAAEQDLLVQANDGHGHFASPKIFAHGQNYMSLGVADYDGDADLDIYACSYYPAEAVPGRIAEPAPLHDARNGGRNVLLRNDTVKPGEWTFSDVTAETGLDIGNSRWSFGVAWEDYDDDGDPDLVVANDFGHTNLYRNGRGHFTDVARDAGMETSAFGMSASWGDYDRDGVLDLYVAGMFTSAGSRIVPQTLFMPGENSKRRSQFLGMTTGNMLYRNKGGGKLDDVTAESGTAMGRWAWASPFVDINNDGWLDILVTNGWLTNDREDDL
ncbi:MAG TPA: VCBS repeat-containing protein [Verrucomicrobiales bacterium]|nr:VCBS repeat-containing protein [Verrucomicrobiales bacterium]